MCLLFGKNPFVGSISDTGNLSQIYLDGVLDVSVAKSLNVSSTDLNIGSTGTLNFFLGSMLDIRLYDGILDSTAVSALYSAGPETSSALEATMYTHVADLTWDAVSGATTYKITKNENGAGEEDVDDTITETLITVANLTPGTPYEFKLYTDLDLINDELSVTDSTPSIDPTSVGDLLVRFSNNLVDLKAFSGTAVDEIDSTLRDVLVTGDEVVTSLGNTVFVADSETLDVPRIGANILTPFDALSGSTQSATVEFEDISTNEITYDESSNEVISDSTNYPVGSYFVTGSYKVRVKEF